MKLKIFGFIATNFLIISILCFWVVREESIMWKEEGIVERKWGNICQTFIRSFIKLRQN